MSNTTPIGTTALNPTIDYMTQRTPIEDILSESDEEEDDPFNSLSTCVFDFRTIPFVSQLINEIVPMSKSA